MKHFIIILIAAIAILTVSSCSSGGSSSTSTIVTPDTTFNGSYFDISYNGKTFHSKDAVVGSKHLVLVTGSATGNTLGVTVNSIEGSGLYGLTIVQFSTYDTGTGYKFGAMGTQSILQQWSPATQFSTNTGSATITHNGTDYLQATFTTTLIASGQSYPATGSFKIVH